MRLRKKSRLKPLLRALLAGISAIAVPAFGSDLSYTYLDFQTMDVSVDAAGIQAPVPTQTVGVDAGDGDGIAVGGSMATGERFYVSGAYRSSIVDVTGTVTSPLTTVSVTDQFDLTLGRLGFGYLHPIGERMDVIAEIAYDSVTYDFGSIAGENFDLDDSGVGGLIGVRWNPIPAIEVFAFARHSPVAKSDLTTLELESDTTAHLGFRWYFFEDLGIGLEYEDGEVETATISMRFSFGNLPW